MEALVAGAAVLGLTLTARQLEAFAHYRDLLLDWNQRMNLTAIVDPAEVETRHFLDSLACALPLLGRWGSPKAVPPLRCLDVGSGGGFPGLPVKLALPQLRVTLLEATGKKAAFLRAAVEALGLHGVEVSPARAEALAHEPAHRQGYDVVFARALARVPTVLELTLPYLRVGGQLIAPRKGAVEEEAVAARSVCDLLGGAPPVVLPVALPDLRDGRALLVVEKAQDTPSRYPRRVGVPARRPLAREARRAPPGPQECA
jgi:16S rRNA (guanine527-N7)-methyltransferase